MVNGPGAVYVERRGRIERAGVHVRRRGRADARDRAHPGAAGAAGGRGVAAVRRAAARRLARERGDPAAVAVGSLPDDPALPARRASRCADLVANGTLPAELAELLGRCACAARASILVSGGTGSGKTTTLNALSGAIPGEERIVTIEDAAELRLRQRHVVRLEARPPNLEGRGEVTIRQLVRNALRMRPDRIVVGEVRGAEALDMLQALNTGHDGSLTTVHANSPRGRAAAGGDARADGGGRAAARGGARAGGERARRWWCTRRGCRTARAWSSRSTEVVRRGRRRGHARALPPRGRASRGAPSHGRLASGCARRCARAVP